jgi:hypothetical protein
VSAKPTIFISHSTGKLPSSDKCVLVKEGLVPALEAKGWHVFLDSQSVNGGALWRTDILHSLATAQAGIILLNEDASKSDWVKAEALVMCFRKSIDPDFPLLPVIFPGADINATFLKTYEPFEFHEIQRLTVNFASGESVNTFAQSLADNPNLERGRRSARTEVAWVQKVAYLLSGLEHAVLCRAASRLTLELEPELPTPTTRETLCLHLRWALANLMHHKQVHECLDALSELMAALPEEKVIRLKPHLLSKWVENESAEMLLHSIRTPAQQGLLALNTSRQVIADRYTERIRSEIPPGGPRFWVFSVQQPNGDYDQPVLQQKVEQAIRKRLLPLPIHDADGSELSLDAAVRQRLQPTNQFALCVLPMQYSLTALLKQLRARFPRIIFIALAGDQGQQTANCVAAGGRPLKPQLTPQKLNELSQLFANWEALFEQYFPQDHAMNR